MKLGAQVSCFRCGWKGCVYFYGARAKESPAWMQRPRYETVHAIWRDIFRAGQPITEDDPAGVYLLGRSCAVPVGNGHFVYHPASPYDDKDPNMAGYDGVRAGRLLPAIIAGVSDVITGEPINLHRTFIKADGSGKAEVDPNRKLLFGHRKSGGVVRLHADEYVTYGLAIGEGLETCLSFALYFAPVWCCLDAGNLAKFPVLPGLESLTVLVDHDDAGHRAFEQVRQRYNVAGIEVRRIESPIGGQDINDIARAAS